MSVSSSTPPVAISCCSICVNEMSSFCSARVHPVPMGIGLPFTMSVPAVFSEGTTPTRSSQSCARSERFLTSLLLRTASKGGHSPTADSVMWSYAVSTAMSVTPFSVMVSS